MNVTIKNLVMLNEKTFFLNNCHIKQTSRSSYISYLNICGTATGRRIILSRKAEYP